MQFDHVEEPDCSWAEGEGSRVTVNVPCHGGRGDSVIMIEAGSLVVNRRVRRVYWCRRDAAVPAGH